MTVMSHKMFNSFDGETSLYGQELMSLAFCFYINFIMIAGSNSVSGVSISAEKNNFAVLKTLPLSGEKIVLSKLKVSYVITGIISIASFIAYVVSANVPLKPIFGLLVCIAYFLSGSGLSAWEIMRDLQRPNFRFNNVNELTRNNKRMLLPVLTATVLGIIIMLSGILLGSMLPDNLLYIGYLVFFVMVYLLSALIFILPYLSIKKKADEMYFSLEV